MYNNNTNINNDDVIIINITMFMKGYVCFLFLDPQNEVGPSISSTVVLCSFVLSVYIVVLVLITICIYIFFSLYHRAF